MMKSLWTLIVPIRCLPRLEPRRAIRLALRFGPFRLDAVRLGVLSLLILGPGGLRWMPTADRENGSNL